VELLHIWLLKLSKENRQKLDTNRQIFGLLGCYFTVYSQVNFLFEEAKTKRFLKKL